ncbi:alpha-(1,3)-fucosyltransferase C-like isoform X1 [Macrobrachium rosenbergii]|uniref:alpha-(1,3)-fucosyltransferase C-like isoform X1 n=3 Tax=Macrobrachium rosenbergii TaxID=79674 RepID=UPI0034D6E9AC
MSNGLSSFNVNGLSPSCESCLTSAGKMFNFAAVAILALFLAFIWIVASNQFPSDEFQSRKTEIEKKPSKCSLPKRILMWTTLWGEQSFGWEKIFYRQVSRQCEESHCELVYDHRLLDSADAVVFHPIDLHPDYVLPEYHPPNQIWIFFTLEAPAAVVEDQHVNMSHLGGLFNWTMTYRRDSDVVVPYGKVIPKTLPSNHTPKVRDYWAEKSKTKLAAWMVSHCGTLSRREWFVKELVKYIRVDVFGRCGFKKCGKNISFKTLGTFDQYKCNAEIETYMFYFAFENAICDDYVTEKFFVALQLNVVPVVFGGGNYEEIAPPDSFINALNFPSPKALAEYLKMVSENASIYNKYLEWKNYYDIELGHPFNPLICDLCSKLHNQSSLQPPVVTMSSAEAAGIMLTFKTRDHTGSYPDIESWFVKGSACRRWWAGPYDYRKHWNL